ncbi:gamma-glutamyl-gamma-aminobutyrate hydrolase family protein [Conexibacter woesei]|uniref:Peptidase C26 n=1 Tax=Conexibacter woesei (strain DSM 14684 / CCUG 47730 / CIP 108061 / JCM 11494 / NBRC 100937 / ID131577) TaxID=469383 RepID=D3F7T5_CONWI|nr:gamma-glutamyl-gamma-aminobutyrate hydrolase family protein [Conexibacter woesei]ADB52829.1 peptidase C26 [Conexibacter woesei DSM 14684]
MSDSDARRRPLIGVCAAWERVAWSFWDQQAAVVAGTYLGAVRRAGGTPVVLTPEPLGDAQIESHGAWLDGLLLIGGADIDPACYGQQSAERTEATYPLRDQFEIALVRAAFDWDLPVLGICRGLQVLNVATGGSLHQHVTDAGFAEHRPVPGRLGESTLHVVEVEPGAPLAADAERQLIVNSHHHQGVDQVGEGGRVVARSVPDHLVEAVEWPQLRYALGVQWHPEELELDMTIADLVAAAADRAAAANRVEAIR